MIIWGYLKTRGFLMKVFLPVVAAIGLFATPALAGFASGPATPAPEAPAAPPPPPQLDACKAYCNSAPSIFGANMADSGTIRANCPEDSVARGGSTIYELVEGLDHQKE